jgi:RNA polymerase sigma-70 factor (ECF subfamily)
MPDTPYFTTEYVGDNMNLEYQKCAEFPEPDKPGLIREDALMSEDLWSESDLSLFDCARKGNTRAYSVLFKKYYEQLYQFAGRYVHDMQSAEEIVQDVFVHIWENRQKFRITTSVKAYLYKAVRNKALNHIKAMNVKSRRMSESSWQLEQDVRTPEQELESGRVTEAFYAALRQLPERGRQVFLMKKLDGLTYPEIADTLNISENTAKTLVFRSVNTLRKKLGTLLMFIAVMFTALQ